MPSKIVWIFPFIILLSFITTKSKRKCFYIGTFTVLVFAILAATRSVRFPDTIPYIDFFYNGSDNIEKGYLILAAIVKFFFGDSPRILFFIIALLNGFIYLRIITNSDFRYPIIVLALVYSYYGIFLNFVVLRAGIANSFILLAIFSFEKSKIRFWFYFVIAMLFHKTSLFLLPAFFIMSINKKFSRPIYFLIIAFMYAYSLVGVDRFIGPFIYDLGIFGDRINYYFTPTKLYWQLIDFGVIYYVITTSYLVLESKGREDWYFRLLNVYMFGFITSLSISTFANSIRVFDLFLPLSSYMIGYTLSDKENKVLRTCVVLFFVLTNLGLLYSRVGQY